MKTSIEMTKTIQDKDEEDIEFDLKAFFRQIT